VLPPHAKRACSTSDPCGFTCDDPYTKQGDQCVCLAPNLVCNGQCGPAVSITAQIPTLFCLSVYSISSISFFFPPHIPMPLFYLVLSPCYFRLHIHTVSSFSLVYSHVILRTSSFLHFLPYNPRSNFISNFYFIERGLWRVSSGLFSEIAQERNRFICRRQGLLWRARSLRCLQPRRG
jgi:hypothetical protein